MTLNRRIILCRKKSKAETEIITNLLEGPAPEPVRDPPIIEKPVIEKKQQKQKSHTPQERPWWILDWLASEPHQIGANHGSISFKNFFLALGMNITKDVIYCRGCKVAGTFEADTEHRTIKCLHCRRTASFEQFEKEHK